MEINIQRLFLKDLEKAKLNCTQFQNLELKDQDLTGFLSNEDNLLITAEYNFKPVGQMIGYVLRSLDHKGSKLFLYSIDVFRPYRRKGIASSMIENFLDLAKEFNCRKCFVLTNENNLPAMELYRSAGGKRLKKDDAMFTWTTDRTI